MDLPRNRFKHALRSGRGQVGIWNHMGGNTVPEVLGAAGFDWVLVDCEHSALETIEVLPALQALGQYPEVSALVRPAANDPVLIKRVLDFGAQTLLLPYVQTGAEARAAVDAMRYGPRGVRGMAGMTRATRYGTIADYARRADEELCLVVQVESALGVENLDEIATTDGVDAVFIGPADLSASLGHPGDPAHPEVQAVVDRVLDRLAELGVPSGIMELDPERADTYLRRGVAMVAVGVDLSLLAAAVRGLAARNWPRG